MVNRCCVSNCKSGHRSSLEKVSMFKAPNDPDLFRKWELALVKSGSTLKKNSHVCSKHFKKEDIINKKVLDDGSRIIYYQAPLQRCKLNSGAVPIIFNTSETKTENTSSLNQSEESNEMIVKSSCEGNVLAHNNQNIIDSQLEFSDRCSQNLINNKEKENINPKSNGVTEKETTTPPHPSSEGESRFLNDSSQNHAILTDIVSSIKTTDWSAYTPWSLTELCDPRMIIFTLQEHVSNDDECVILKFQKQVTIEENNSAKVFIYDKLFTQAHIENIEELRIFLDKVKNFSVCLGGPKSALYRNVHPTCAYRDTSVYKWRHNSCQLVIGSGSVCSYCLKLDGTLRKHIDARLKGKQHSKIRSNMLLPTTKKIYDIKNKAMRIQSRKLHRIKKLVDKLKQELRLSMEQMRKIKADKLSFELEKYKEKLPHNQEVLIQECLRASKSKTRKNFKYNKEWLLLCLLLHIKSPATYHFLRNNDVLPLPCQTRIKKYLNSMRSEWGFDNNFFSLLKKKFDKISEERVKHGILVFDEMSVRESLDVNSNSFSLNGCSDFSTNNNPSKFNELADHALVFMFRSIGDNFTQPIGVFACKGPTKGQTLAQLVLQAIILLENSGAYVEGIVCDGASTNRKMWTEFGVSGKMKTEKNGFENKNYFLNPIDDSRKIFVFSDTPHLFKCIRNNLMKQNFKVDGLTVCWKDYENLFYFDEKNPAHERVCPKLTINHIKPSNLLKMRVYLAVQIFSRSTAAGLKFYRDQGYLQDVDGTIKFTLRMNKLFDLLNCTSGGIKKEDLRDINMLKEALAWLDSWEENLKSGKIKNCEFLTPVTAEGLRVTLKSTIQLAEYLLSLDKVFLFVLTGKMNQDPLEQFFGIIRQAGCQNDHPNFITFIHLYKMLSIFKILQPPKFGNCQTKETKKPVISMEDITSIFDTTAKVSSSQMKIAEIKEKLNAAAENDDICDIFSITSDNIDDHDYQKSTVSECIIYYLSGYICRKMCKVLDCPDCKKVFEDCVTLNARPQAQLVDIKNRGKLIHANNSIFYMLMKTEEFFIQAVNEKICYILDFVIENMLRTYKFDNFPCQIHRTDVISKILFYYTLMRMRQFVKAENRARVKNNKLKKKESKLVKT